MKKIKCVICGLPVAPGARKHCPSCQANQATLHRRIATIKFRQRLDSLPTIRECVKCKEIKKHHRQVNWCVDCSKDRKVKKVLEPEDILFLSLINKARLSNHALSNKIRKSTAQESEELWLQRSVSSVGRVVEKALQ